MINIFSKIKNKWIVVLLAFICLIPVIYGSFIWLQIGTPIHIVFSIFLLAFSFFLLPFILFKMRTAFFITWIWVLLAPLELASFYVYKSPFRGGVMLLMLQTNVQESIELLSAYKMFVIIYLTLLIAYPILVSKFIKNISLFDAKIKKILLGTTAMFFVVLYAYSFKVSYDKQYGLLHNIKHANGIFELKFIKIYPYNILRGANKGIDTYNQILGEDKVAKDFNFGAVQTKKTEEREIYVFVIGETARSNHFGINGYKRATTPLLEKTDNLFSFTNVLSEANLTSISLPILLTRATAKKYSLKNKEKGIVDLFNEVGFDSYWIANQSLGNTFIHRMAKDTKQHFFTPQDIDSPENYDEKLWKHLDEVLNKKEKKQFIVIHTLGSHFRYNQRYPKNFEKFQPALNGLTDLNLIGKGLKEELINSYDNTIYYTDYFLANTIKKLEQENAISYLFYLSDHAESLFDNDVIFHGSRNPLIGEAHVPMLVWFSDKYIKFNPQKINIIKNNLDKKITSAVTFYSLSDMANIHFEKFSEKYITNKNLKSDSVRYLINPDLEIREFR